MGQIFGFFVAAPVAIGLIMLSTIGISKFEDIQRASSTVDAKIIEAQTKFDAVLKRVDPVVELALQDVQKASSAADAKIIEAQTKVDAALKKLDPVIDLALQNVAKTEQQLASKARLPIKVKSFLHSMTR